MRGPNLARVWRGFDATLRRARTRVVLCAIHGGAGRGAVRVVAAVRSEMDDRRGDAARREDDELQERGGRAV